MLRYWLPFVVIFWTLPATADIPIGVTQVDKLDCLAIRQHAATVDALVQITQPKFVSNGTDLLWITHDSAGKVGFAMNRAYHLQIGPEQPAWYLLESHDNWLDPPDRPWIPYTRCVDPNPKIVARDPVRGVVYQTCWNSAPLSGSGADTTTRNIFLLCDGSHHWHLLGEGPIADSGADGISEYRSQSVEADVTWTDDSSSPVKLNFVLLSKDDWGMDDDNPNHPTLTIRQRMVPGPVDTAGVAEGIDPADIGPGPFKQQGPQYVILTNDEPRTAFTLDLLHYCCILPNQMGQAKNAQILRSAENALKQTNPSLGSILRRAANCHSPKIYGPFLTLREFRNSRQ